MLPELDVLHANSDQFVCSERVTLHHKDLLLVTSEEQLKGSSDEAANATMLRR